MKRDSSKKPELIFTLLIAVLVGFPDILNAQYVSGQTYYGKNQYIEYKCGNYPLVISAPHAGTVTAAEMQDRSCGATDNDMNTYETVLAIRDSIDAKTGKYPHLIINHLRRIKLDPNREVSEATCGDTVALISYKEYHAFIDSARAQMLRSYGKGLYNDFHGHGHAIQRIEIGYMLTSDDLAKPDSSLDSALFINKSGVKYLAGIVPMTFSQLIRGPKSLGNIFEEQGYPAVPSLAQPNPGTASYFDGGFSVGLHGSMNGGTIDGIQLEVNYAGIRDNDANRRAFAGAYSKVMDRFIQVNYFGAKDSVVFGDTVNSLANGNWSSPATWKGGIAPSSTKNVVIGSGTVVTVDVNTAQCKDISFESADSKLAMAADGILNIYGNFTLASETHNAFSSWAPGAKIRFTGNLNQLLKGWSTTGLSTSFHEMVIDKPGMKVTTSGTNMKLAIGSSLEIVNGTFELAGTDDIEGWTLDAAASAPVITVQSGGIFTMVGGGNPSGSYIRKGTNGGSDDRKIGKMTVSGEVYFATSDSTRKINLGGIDINNGGAVYFSTSRGTQTASFNPGTITINSGGLFKNSLSTNIWYPNSATPTSVIINNGGEYYQAGGTTYLPQSVAINTGGIVRYYSTAASTLPAGISTYENLFITGTSSKLLGTHTTVNGILSIQNTASINRNGKTLTYGPRATLQYGYSGQVTAQTTSDSLLPATGGPPNLNIYNTAGVTLHADRTITGTLSLSAGSLSTGSSTMTLGPSAVIAGEQSGQYCIGNLNATRSVGTGGNDFGGMGVSISAGSDNLGAVTVTRVSGPGGVVTVNGKQGIARRWVISSDAPPSLGRNVTFSWTSGDDNGKDLTTAQLWKSTDQGRNWFALGSPVNISSTHSLTVAVNSFSHFTVSDRNNSISAAANEPDAAPTILDLGQNYPNPFNPTTHFRFTVPDNGPAKVTVFTMLGQMVGVLWNGQAHSGRYYEVVFDAIALPGGLYLVRLEASGSSIVRKILFLK